MKNATQLVIIAVTFLLVANPAEGSIVYTIASDASDGTAYHLFPPSTGQGNFPTQDLIVGSTHNANYAGIALFELPDLNGGQVVAADLTFTVKVQGTLATANADIYGLGYVVPSPSMQSQWLLTSDTETRDGNTLGTNLGTDLPVKLVDNAVAAGITMLVNDTTVVSGSGLVDFVNSLYTDYGAQAGDYAVFRVNPDADQSASPFSNFRYGGSQQGTQATMLSLTVAVPEPSSALLLSGLLSSLVFSRRRRSITA